MRSEAAYEEGVGEAVGDRERADRRGAEVTPVSEVGAYTFKPGRAGSTLINAYTEAVTPKKVAAE